MRRILWIIVSLMVATLAIAQENTQAEKPKTDILSKRTPYRLDFTIKELEETKVVNTRSYSMLMESAEDNGVSYGELKAGSRVPIVTSNKDGQPSTVYMDVGISLSSRLHIRVDGFLVLTNNAEISSLVTSGPGTMSGSPIVRAIRSQTASEIVAGKTQVVATVDDPVSTHRFQIEATATKLR